MRIRTTIYTPDAFFNTYKDYLFENTDKYDIDDEVKKATDPYLRANKTLEKYQNKEVEFVVIDEEYEQWLQKYGYKNDHDARHYYSSNITDQDAQRLWEKNGINEKYESVLLQVKCKGETEKDSYEIDEDLRTKIKDSLSSMIGVSSMCLKVSPYAYSLDYINQHAFGDESFLRKELKGETTTKKHVFYRYIMINARYIHGNTYKYNEISPLLSGKIIDKDFSDDMKMCFGNSYVGIDNKLRNIEDLQAYL